MKETDRKFYNNLSAPYVDQFESIDSNIIQSAPHMHAYVLEKLVDLIKADSKILDVNSGSGYILACFARIIQARANENFQDAVGNVIGIEQHEKLFKHLLENILADDPKLLSSGLIKIVQTDGRKDCEQFGPFDVIHIGTAIAEIPMELLMQLNLNGRLLCPVGEKDGVQLMMQCDRNSAGEITEKVLTNVIFDPLVDSFEEQQNSDSMDEQPWTDSTDEDSWSEKEEILSSSSNKEVKE